MVSGVDSPSILTVLTTLKRLAIVVSFRSKLTTKTFQKLTKQLILLTIIKRQRVKGIESLILLPDYAHLRSYQQLNAVYVFDT